MNLIPGFCQPVAFRAKFALLELNQQSSTESIHNNAPESAAARKHGTRVERNLLRPPEHIFGSLF